MHLKIKALIILALFSVANTSAHETKELDVTNKCSIEEDKIVFGNETERFYRISVNLTAKEIRDYSEAPSNDKLTATVVGRFPLELSLVVDGKVRAITGILSGFFVMGLPPSTVTGMPTYEVTNVFVNESDDVAIKACLITIDS